MTGGGKNNNKRTKHKLFNVYTPGILKENKRGRPKSTIVLDSNQHSIMTMFCAIPRENNAASPGTSNKNSSVESTEDNGTTVRDEVDI